MKHEVEMKELKIIDLERDLAWWKNEYYCINLQLKMKEEELRSAREDCKQEIEEE